MLEATIFWSSVCFLIAAFGLWMVRNAHSFKGAPWWWRPTLWFTGLMHGQEQRRILEERLASPARIRTYGIIVIVEGLGMAAFFIIIYLIDPSWLTR